MAGGLITQKGIRRKDYGKGRRDVRGMIVRGIIQKTLFPIPLTNIPLTLDFSRWRTGNLVGYA
jgi:hypothetical protein